MLYLININVGLIKLSAQLQKCYNRPYTYKSRRTQTPIVEISTNRTISDHIF